MFFSRHPIVPMLVSGLCLLTGALLLFLLLQRGELLLAAVLGMVLQVGWMALYLRNRLALQQSRTQLNAFMNERTSLVIMTDTRGRIVRASAAAAHLFGRESLANRRYRDIVPAELANRWDEQEKQVREQRTSATTDAALPVEGRPRWFRIERSPWCDERGRLLGVINVAWDISDFRHAEQALQELRDDIDETVQRQTRDLLQQQAQLQNILDTCTDALISIDVQGVILHCNRALERLFGYGQHELTGQNISLLMERETGLQHSQHLAAFLSAAEDQTWVGRWRRVIGKRRDMSLVPIEISVGTHRNGDECFFVGVVRDLSERQRQEHLKEILFEQAQDGSLILEQHRVVDCNATAVRMLGLDAKATLIGKSLLEMSTALQPDGIASAEKYQRLWRFAEDKGSSRFDWRIRRPDGAPLLVEVNISLLDAGGRRQALLVLHDISDRIATQNAIRHSEQRVRDILNSTQQLMCLLAPDGHLLEANRAAAKITGGDADSLVGRTLWNVRWWQDSDALAARLREHIASAMRGQQVRFALPLVDVHGNTLQMDFALTPIMQDDQVELLVLEGYDVTAIHEARQAEQHAREDAEAANQAKGEFLAHMSHEIRTPLNAIIGMTRLCLSTRLNDRQRQYLASVDTAANSLLDIVNDILDFSKIEAGKLELELIPFSLRDVFTHVGAVIGIKAQEKALEFVINDIDVPARLVGDPLRLQQVLLNLCSNAVKFTEHGHVELEVSPVASTPSQVRLRFQIRDTGIGMSEEQQSRLFESFIQGDASISRKYGGSGLGLSICRQLINAMGGDIQMQSVPGQGSTFSFELPFRADGQWSAAPICRLPVSHQQILVVDDNPVCWKIEKRILLNAGYRVSVAESGQAALDWLRQHGEHTDLVVLDWDLPDMNGEQLMQAMVNLLGEQAPPVLLVTAYGQHDILRDTDCEPQGFLSKPIQSVELCDRVERILSQLPVTAMLPLPGDFAALDPAMATPRILLVEDNEINRFLVMENLQALGVQLDTAENGSAALEKLAHPHYDLVLMDLQMPVMDGFECCEHLRRDYDAEQLPVIAMTANAFNRERQRAQAVGMNAFITKPFDNADLLQTIADHLPDQLTPWKQWALAQVRQPVSDESLQNLPGISLQSALARVHHDQSRYRALLQQYAEHYGQVAATLTRLLQECQWPLLVEWAHKLKGVAGNLGFDDLYRLAAEAEQAGERQDAASLRGVVAAIQHENTQVLASIAHLLAATTPLLQTDTHTWNALQQADWLAGIRQQLDASEIVDDRDIDRLRQTLTPVADSARLDQLCRAIGNFDATQALHLLDQIMLEESP